jgi:hypothetical protein
LDEAQELLKSAKGDKVLWEIKAARDTLNLPGSVNLMLVMSGSDRDKLGRITNTKSAAFYGSRIRDMPLLGEDYIRWMSGLLAMSYPTLGTVSIQALNDAFLSLGSRPADLDEVIGQALSPVNRAGRSFEDSLAERVRLMVASEEARYLGVFAALTPTQRSVLTVLMASGARFSPFAAPTLKAIGAVARRTIATSTVQGVLNKMRSTTPPLIWLSNRGEYAVEDQGMVVWYAKQVAAGTWPPLLSSQPSSSPRKKRMKASLKVAAPLKKAMTSKKSAASRKK